MRIGVDTGGTFTDVVRYDEATGEVSVTKTPSTPPDFDEGVLAGIDEILDRAGRDGTAVSFVGHGTTVGTNAVLEGEIPPIGLITNEGLRDVLEIGDQTRPALYDLQTDKPPALIPRRRRREVPGRIDAEGNEVEPLDEDRARAVVDDLVGAGVESIVVSMLFSYLNDDHERRIARLIEAHEADVDYARSSAVHPEIREYDRTITTVLNEAIKSTVGDYLERLEAGLRERGIDAPLNVMHAGGGVFSASAAADNAVRTILSGPAAGAVATRRAGRREGFENVIGMDMGGTSADVCVVRDGELVRATEGELNDLPLKVPMIDITTVGAGGGSVARIDEGGALRVGPQSVGADPGPICYDRGGDRPTVTDANLLLGRLDPGSFLGGEMELAVDRTRERFAERIADPLGRPVEAAALDVVEVANASLARELRRVTVERGTDPGSFALVAFGGAGPLQAAPVAREMGMETIVVPPSPGVFSARGLLVADVRMDETHAYRRRQPDAAAIGDQFEELEADLMDRFAEQGFSTADVDLERDLDIRYAGQSYELTVSIDAREIDPAAVDAVVEAFHREHERRYGHAMPDEPVEIVTLRTAGVVPTADLSARPAPTDRDARLGERDAYFAAGGARATAIYDRTALAPGGTVEGPAIIEAAGSTTLVPPEASATVSDHGALLLSPGSRGEA